MDIEKFKAEFEQSECFKRLEHVAQYTFFEFGAYIKRTDVPADIEKKCGKLITALLFSWSAWKEAKTQADQKIKLLLCDEHLKKCESPTGIFNSQYPDEEPCLICLAKRAKAQAVPEVAQRQGGYYIRDLRSQPGNCMKFWYQAGYGTKHKNFFWCATLEEAKEYKGGCDWFEIWHAPYIDSLVEYTVDFQLADRGVGLVDLKAQEPAND